MCEFKKGDVVVQIGGSNAYVIDGSYETAIWYSVKYLWSGKIFHAEVHKFTIDKDYVKVDFCKRVFDDDYVYWKLIPIVKALTRS